MKEEKEKIQKIISNNRPYRETWAELYTTLQELLDRRQALLQQVEEFKQIDNALKNYFSGVSICHIGPYKVQSHEVKEETYCLPHHIRNKYTFHNRKWEIEISKI